jgi:predicted outer membrane repeat protein
MTSTAHESRRTRSLLGRLPLLGVAVGSLLGGFTVLSSVAPAGAATNLYVASTGSNTTNSCTNPATPCLTIQHAINVASNGNVINLAGGTYRENIEITKNLTIAGTAAGGSLGATTSTINGVEGFDFVVDVDPGKTVTLSNLVITGVNAISGGIFNDGILTVDNVNVQDNVGFGDGAGISNEGELTMNGGVVSGNQATDNTSGGGILNDGEAVLNGVTFTHNSATADGGAIFNAGLLKLTGASAIHNNSAADDGGGIFECNGDPLSIGPKVSITANTPDDVVHGSCV